MRRIDTLQNLILITMADGKVTPEEKEIVQGYASMVKISPKDLNELIYDIQHLDFIVPATQEEKLDELFKLIVLTLADGELAGEEYRLLKTFSDKCGFNRTELDELIQQTKKEYQKNTDNTLKNNREEYDYVLKVLKQSGKSDKEIAEKLRERIRDQKLDYEFDGNIMLNDAFYKLLWILYIRYAVLYETAVVLIPMKLGLIIDGSADLEDLLADVKISEEAHFDGNEVHLSELSTEGLENIKKQLKNSYSFNH